MFKIRGMCRDFMCAPSKVFFPGLSFYVYIESPNPKEPRIPHTTGPKANQLKTPTPRNQSKTPTPTQTAMNEQKCEKIIKNKPGKNIACFQDPYHNLNCYNFSNKFDCENHRLDIKLLRQLWKIVVVSGWIFALFTSLWFYPSSNKVIFKSYTCVFKY